MGPSDDYGDEMDRLSSQDADQVLAGQRAGSGASRVAAAAADRLRQELLVSPAPAVAERHLAAMRAAVSQAGVEGGHPVQTKTRKRFASLALAATLVLGAGIAGALTLPPTASEQAQEQTADLEKGPGNQGDDVGIQSSEHGTTVSGIARDDSTEGCEHGRAVSAAASAKADDNRKNEGDHPGECGPSDGQANAQGNGAAASAAKGNNGNHGEGNDGNHGANRGQSSVAGGDGSNSGGNGKNELPHGRETAPGQAATETTSETSGESNVPDNLLPPGA